MFLRKLKSKNGNTYVQVVDKSSGKYKVIKSFGGSDDPTQVEVKVHRAKSWMRRSSGMNELDFSNSDQLIEQFLGSIDKMKRVGFDYLLGRIFCDIGFDKIEDEFFKYLVLGRIAYPKSKLKTTEFLLRYHHIDWDEDQVYRYLDNFIPPKRRSSSRSAISTP